MYKPRKYPFKCNICGNEGVYEQKIVTKDESGCVTISFNGCDECAQFVREESSKIINYIKQLKKGNN